MTGIIETFGASSFILILGMKLLSAIFGRAHGSATEEDYLKLHNVLTSNYSRHMRPVKDQSAPVLVGISFSLISILELKDTENQLNFIAAYELNWMDPNLVWNPGDFGGIDRMRLTEETIWAPKLTQYLSLQNEGYLMDNTSSHQVDYTGNVVFKNVAHRKSFCQLDMTYFPYDYQKCSIEVRFIDTYASDVDVVNATAMGDAISHNKEWLLINVSSQIFYIELGFDRIVMFTAFIILKRRPTFSNFNIIIPAAFINVLCMLTFFVPIESGERLSYSLTTLLALSVYITYIGGLIPSSSNPIPILFQYIVSVFIVCVVCVILTLVVIRVRWSKVRRSHDDQKYINVLGCRISLSGKRWFNEIWTGNWHNDNKNKINQSKEGFSGIKKYTDQKDETVMRKLSSGSGSSIIDSKSHLSQPVPETEMKKLSDSRLNPDRKISSTIQDNNYDAENALKDLCKCFDLIGFCLAFFSFFVLTCYTFVQFSFQEEPGLSVDYI